MVMSIIASVAVWVQIGFAAASIGIDDGLLDGVGRYYRGYIYREDNPSDYGLRDYADYYRDNSHSIEADIRRARSHWKVGVLKPHSGLGYRHFGINVNNFWYQEYLHLVRLNVCVLLVTQ